MSGYSWDYMIAAYHATKFFGRQYGGERYWRALSVDPDWLLMYDMGGEI